MERERRGDRAGVRVTINPARISVPARGYASFIVTVEARGLPDGTYFAKVLLRSGKRLLHLPISFVRAQPPVALEQRCDPAKITRDKRTTCTITATQQWIGCGDDQHSRQNSIGLINQAQLDHRRELRLPRHVR